MGAIIYGGVDEELINLNESTLWSGEPDKTSIDATVAQEVLKKIRKALSENNYYEAERLQYQLQGRYYVAEFDTERGKVYQF